MSELASLESSRRSALTPMGRGTLSRKLVLRVAGLVTLVAILLGLASTLAVRHQLMATMDSSLHAAIIRSQRFDDGQGAHRPPPGTAVGQITLRPQDSTTAVLWIEGGSTNTAAAVAQQLRTVPSGVATTMHLANLGSYRVLSVSTPSGNQVVALPLAGLNHTLRELVLSEIVLTLAALVAAILLGRALIASALRPLTRLASTATEVSNLELDHGEVEMPMRVPGGDADPSNEVGRVGHAFNHMLNNVEGALATRQQSETKVRQFVADASHELRNPLAAIRGYAELTRRGGEQLPTDAAYAISRIEAESTRMSRLVEDMLLLARLDNDPTLDLASVDVIEVVLNAVSDAQVAGPTHDWGVDLPEGRVIARADALKLHQVVANLLSNARKHTPEGTQVTAGVRAEGRFAVITVTDNGPGIDPSVKEQVFERFARADTARAHNLEGSTGLGLAIVAAVMEAHGGDATVESAPGHTCFTLHVPLA